MVAIAYHTLGCKVNQYETEKMRERLETAGCATVSFDSPADVYIINTCSVTHTADGKSRAAVRRALRMNPEAYLVVAGCCAELEPARVGQIEGVDLVVPNREKDAIPERIISRFGGQIAGCAPGSHTSPRPRVRTRAVVKVQDGCDQFCAYCVIPYARSRRMSRPVEDVVAELESLAQFGYREIVLTGIRLGSYAHDGSRLPELIAAAADVNGVERIRLSSIEPWEVDDSLLDTMQHPKLCRHLHIPLQSGDDGVLRRMGRPYDSARYREIISRVRTRIEGVGITTDIIAGFPGETEEAFGNTLALAESARFSRLHVFRYSKRRGTRAADMPDQVDAETKRLRAEKLLELGKTSVRRFAGSLVGAALEVLVEDQPPRKSGESFKHLHGYADNYAEVVFAGDPSLKGEVVRVKITGADEEGRAVGISEAGAIAPAPDPCWERREVG